jgi:hypothetical protein
MGACKRPSIQLPSQGFLVSISPHAHFSIAWANQTWVSLVWVACLGFVQLSSLRNGIADAADKVTMWRAAGTGDAFAFKCNYIPGPSSKLAGKSYSRTSCSGPVHRSLFNTCPITVISGVPSATRARGSCWASSDEFCPIAASPLARSKRHGVLFHWKAEGVGGTVAEGKEFLDSDGVFGIALFSSPTSSLAACPVSERESQQQLRSPPRTSPTVCRSTKGHVNSLKSRPVTRAYRHLGTQRSQKAHIFGDVST